MAITHVERGLLKILVEAGGRHTFRPDAGDQVSYGVFDRDVVRILYSLRRKAM